MCGIAGQLLFDPNRLAERNMLGRMLGAMFGLRGIGLDASEMGYAPLWVPCLLLFVWFLPNTQQIMAQVLPALEYAVDTKTGLPLEGAPSWLRWRPNAIWALAIAVMAALGVLGLSRVTQFLYFVF